MDRKFSVGVDLRDAPGSVVVMVRLETHEMSASEAENLAKRLNNAALEVRNHNSLNRRKI